MKIRRIIIGTVALSLMLVAALSILRLGLKQKPLKPIATPTQITANLVQVSGSGGGGNGGSGGGGGSGGSGGNAAGGTGNNTDPQIPSTPDITPSIPTGPYIVKQIVTLGNETISGQVCNITQTFKVTSATPDITFIMTFTPLGADHGNLSYSYNFPSLGESHDATGSYTLALASNDGTLLLSMTTRDHVVFKGYDGIMPINYKFDLVPSTQTTCP